MEFIKIDLNREEFGLFVEEQLLAEFGAPEPDYKSECAELTKIVLNLREEVRRIEKLANSEIIKISTENIVLRNKFNKLKSRYRATARNLNINNQKRRR